LRDFIPKRDFVPLYLNKIKLNKIREFEEFYPSKISSNRGYPAYFYIEPILLMLKLLLDKIKN